MERDKKDGRVAPEDVLRTVAVMHVPVEDGDALGDQLDLGPAGRNGDITEEAEAHRASG